MGFLHGGFLFGLGSLALPLLFHFLRRQQVRRVPFSTLRFFQLIQRRSSMLFRIGHLLLLLLRLAVLAFVTLLFAQPFFTDPDLRHWNSGPRTLVLLVDNSASMGARRPDGSRLRDGLAARLAARLVPVDARDRLHVLALSPRARRVYAGALGDFDPAALPGVTAAGADWDGGLAEASEIYDREQASDRVLLLVSDFQAADWNADRVRRLPKATVELLRPGVPPRVNAGLVTVEEDGARAVTGRPWAVRATVSRGKLVDAGGPRTLELVRRRRQGPPEVLAEAQLPAEAVAALRFETRFDEVGSVDLALRLRGEPDGLEVDDELPLRVEVGGPQRLLCWNGDPRPAHLYDELFYLEKAARAAGLEVDVVSRAEELALRDPEGYAAFHLVNVADPRGSEAFVARLLEARGALVLWLGDKVQPEAWAPWLRQELDQVALIGRASHRSGAPWSYASPGELVDSLQGLRSQRFWKGIASRGYWFLEPGAAFQPGGVLARHADRTPALYGGRAGRGFVLLVNAGADLEDSDLPMHPIFPALIRRSGLFGEGPLPTYRAGEPVRFPVDDERQAENMMVRTPDGRQVLLRPELGGGSLGAVLRDTLVPGLYGLVEGTGPGARTSSFQVRPDPAESILDPLEPRALALLLPTSRGRSPDPAPASPVRLRDLLLLGLCLALLGEAWLVGYLETSREGMPEAR